MNDLDTRVLNAAERLELAVKQSTDAATKLLKCAESISNPTYSITMDGQVLEILAVSHFAGQINIQVKSPFNNAMSTAARALLGGMRHEAPGLSRNETQLLVDKANEPNDGSYR